MKRLIAYIGIFSSIVASGSFSPLFAAEAKCTPAKVQACIDANKDGKAKTITDYVCPVGTLKPQQIAFQVCMSIDFKELDDKVKKDLKTIHEKSNKDVGKLASNIRDLFDSSNPDALYPAQYEEVCNSLVMNDTVAYFEEKNKSSTTNDGVTTDNDASYFLFWQNGCSNLVKKKLDAYKNSAWLLWESALVKSFQNDKHNFMRRLKDQYEKFLNKWTTYIGQLSVIKDKWPSKTPKVQ